MSISGPSCGRHLYATVLATLAVISGCADLTQTAPPTSLDDAAFACNAEPVLMVRCAYGGCHGSDERPPEVGP